MRAITPHEEGTVVGVTHGGDICAIADGHGNVLPARQAWCVDGEVFDSLVAARIFSRRHRVVGGSTRPIREVYLVSG